MGHANVTLSMTRSSLDGHLDIMRNQVNTITNDMLVQILSDKTAAEGGDIWLGAGADNFVAEITGKVKGEIEDLTEALHTFFQMIDDAATSVEATDQSLATSDVEALRAECSNIY